MWTLIMKHLIALRLRLRARLRLSPCSRADAGQTTAEYALVLLGAASLALLLIAWAAQTGRIGALFDTIFDHVVGEAT